MTDAPAPEPVTVPKRRGRTVISERVLRKIAAHDAQAVLGVIAAGRVRAHRRHQQVDLRLNLTVAYPLPAAATAHQVRERVTSRMRRFAGYEVSTLDITVSYEYN